MCINKSTFRQLLLAYPCYNCFIRDHTNLKKISFLSSTTPILCTHLVYFQITYLHGQNAVYYMISFKFNEYPAIAIQNGRIDIY